MGTWAVAEAKAKFSEIIETAREQGAQQITRNGKLVGVLVSPEEWEGRKRRKKPFVSAWDALAPSSGATFDADFPRLRNRPRAAKF